MKEIYLLLARVAIAQSIGLEYDIDLEEILQKYPKLKDDGASFVTITTGDENILRGCIGSLEAYRPLYEDIIINARAAALHDPRFSSLTKKEYDDIKIEVSILSKPQVLDYDDVDDLQKKIKIFKDGVVLKLDNKQATFLPQVWEQLPEFSLFFTHLCQKAGLSQECLKEHPVIFTYQVEKYEE